MEIKLIPVLSDNYIFLLHDPLRHEAVVIDPALADPVLVQLSIWGARLTAIWNTHHHGDHVGGNRDLIRAFPDLVVYGSQYDVTLGRIPGGTVSLKEGDRVEFAKCCADVMHVPGHTLGHLAYYFPPGTASAQGDLFCGDTLFAGGCGRLFEGSAAQMLIALNRFRHLPPQTRLWCAHEYTLNNLRFALTLEPDHPALNHRLATVQALRSVGSATIPSTLDVELQTNPFLRWDSLALMQAVHCQEPLATFAEIRHRKDRF
ncbi:hydroxyacylglutathione hydrolase [Lyngbya confervoides]|uniref:Hydroxyacylglutathione hydrolase n=1 Tax=Lyngbya confervoides BDU141951 TaxID=1574623 RepID=A0ABD4SZJ8_9CYAN|nr:hydroxyacylglutathione hydrolase [Lyngbya confervoides]MCM1981798.1 hydroxyacylglutathione hydrolase [Lyngbya confervoides BDU141951]